MNETPVMRVAVGTDPNSQVIGPAIHGAMRPTDFHLISLRFDAQHAGAASAKEGKPVYDKVLMLRQHYAGSDDKLDVEVKRWPAEGGDAILTDPGRYNLYREAIDRFEKQGEAIEQGTPLHVLNLDPASVANIEGAGIHTVEHLAAVPDSSLGTIKHAARNVRDRARAFLDQTQGGTHLAKLHAENEGLRADVSEAMRQVQELKETIQAQQVAAADGKVDKPATPPKASK